MALPLLAAGWSSASTVPLLSSPPLAPGISGYQLSPDGNHLVFQMRSTPSGDEDLYSVPAAGGSPVLLASGSIGKVEITPDSSRVVYLEDGVGIKSISSVVIDGSSAPDSVMSLFTDSTGQADFFISPDSLKVVGYAFMRDEFFAITGDQLMSASITGADFSFIDSGSFPDISILNIRISPDSQRVVYLKDDFSGYQIRAKELGTPASPVILGESTIYAIAPDSDDVAFYNASKDQIWFVPITGGAEVPIEFSITNVQEMRFTPDGQYLIFRNSSAFYSVPAAGGPISLAFISAFRWEITPDSQRIVAYNGTQVWTAPVTTLGSTINLSGSLASGGTVYDMRLAPDGSRVFFTAEKTAGVIDMFSASLGAGGGAGAVKIGDGVETNVPSKIAFSPDGESIAFPTSTTGGTELFLSSVDGGPLVKLNSPLPLGGVMRDPAFSADGTRVFCNGIGRFPSLNELYSATPDVLWTGGSGSWDLGSNWSSGTPPVPLAIPVIDGTAHVTVPPAPSQRSVASLSLGASSGTALLELVDGGSLHIEGSFDLGSGGALRGDGTLQTGTPTLTIPANAEIGASAGDRLRLVQELVFSSGRVEAFGTAAEPAEIEFDADFENAGGTGMIAAHDARLRFGFLDNLGTVAITGGYNDILGEIDNQASGRIVVSGGGVAAFYDDVNNMGAIHVSSTALFPGAAVFFGSFSGNGISGPGDVFLEGDARPGFSPGTMSFGGNVSYGPFAKHEAELASTTPGTSYDRIDVASHLLLNGELEVLLIDGFVPSAGDVFDLWDAASVSGAFHTITLPALPAGLFWLDSQVNTTGELRVSTVPAGYAEFASYHGLTGDPDEDEDCDGLANLLEYAHGLDPNTETYSPYTASVDASGQIEFTFDLPTGAGADLTLVVETSENMAGWTPQATRDAAGSWTGAAAINFNPGEFVGFDSVTFTLPASPTGHRQFARLRVVQSGL